MKETVQSLERELHDLSAKSSVPASVSPFHTRVVPEARPTICLNIRYPVDLPAASVCICSLFDVCFVILLCCCNIVQRVFGLLCV
jgi:hypothetical protein